MEPSLTALAETLDALVDGDRVVVTETPAAIAVYQLEGREASQIFAHLEACAWTEITASDAGGDIPRDMLAQSGGGITVTATRPALPEGFEAVLTKSGFAAFLERDETSPIVWVYGLDRIIDTRSIRFAPWGNTETYTPLEALATPSKVVRVLGPGDPGSHIDRWLLLAPDEDVSIAALAPWRVRAGGKLLAALSQEIEPDGRLLFRGPPPTRFTVSNLEISATSFAACQEAVTWIFENARELENRHGLLAAEIARTSLRDGGPQDLANTLRSALEGARIAYGFGVTQQSKDTLKALSDLRKAVSDDAAKLSETTRSLGTAIAGAVFGNISLIIARLTLPTNGVFIGNAAILIGVVLLVYVCVMVASGIHYITIQHDLRQDWRERLYRFLNDDEYERMVNRPAKRAETAFGITAIIGVIMAVTLLGAVWLIARTPPPAMLGAPATDAISSVSESEKDSDLGGDQSVLAIQSALPGSSDASAESYTRSK